MKTATTGLWPAALAIGLLAACGGDGGGGTLAPTQQTLNPSVEYHCTQPVEGLMRVPPEAVMGGQIEGRSDGSFVLVSHQLWGVRHVVLLLGTDLTRQNLLSGHIDAVPERLFCPSDGGQYSNGVQYLGESFSGSYIHLKLAIDPLQGSVSGTLRDYGGSSGAQRVSGGPIEGTLFDPAATPSIATVLGSWTLADAAGRPGSMLVAADGTMQLKLAQCSYSGSLAPVNGLNLLSMQLRPEPSCLLDTDETRGFVVLLPLPDGRQQLMLWGVDNGWGLVTQAIGRR